MAFLDSKIHTRLAIVTGNELGLAFPPRKQGWVFAMAKTIFAGTVEKTGKNCGKNWQNQRHHKLITDFITHILQALLQLWHRQ